MWHRECFHLEILQQFQLASSFINNSTRKKNQGARMKIIENRWKLFIRRYLSNNQSNSTKYENLDAFFSFDSIMHERQAFPPLDLIFLFLSLMLFDIIYWQSSSLPSIIILHNFISHIALSREREIESHFHIKNKKILWIEAKIWWCMKYNCIIIPLIIPNCTYWFSSSTLLRFTEDSFLCKVTMMILFYYILFHHALQTYQKHTTAFIWNP